MSSPAQIRFSYVNYRDEHSMRCATPMRFWFGATEYHPDPQWIMTAFDHGKKQDRDFALADCDFTIPEHFV